MKLTLYLKNIKKTQGTPWEVTRLTLNIFRLHQCKIFGLTRSINVQVPRKYFEIIPIKNQLHISAASIQSLIKGKGKT